MLANEEINKDSEQLVIAAILLESTAFFRVSAFLQKEMFFTDVHKEIYQCVSKMSDKAEAIDLLTVGNALKNNDCFIKAGGVVYIARLTGRLTSTSHLEQHAYMVLNAYISRKVMIFASQLTELARLNDLPAENLLVEVHNKIDVIDKEIPCFNSILHAPEVIQLSKEAGLKRVEQYRDGITCTGISTGLPELDEMLGGWQNGELNILAARPSMGKTALAIHFANMACRSNKHALIYSLEMNSAKLGDRMLIAKSNIEANHWRLGSCNMYDLEAIEQASSYLSDLPFHVDDTTQIGLSQIKASARRMQQKGQCDMLIIDYLQLIDMKAANKLQTRQELVLEASRHAKGIAKDLDIPVILLSQLNRESESHPGKRPELANLRESGAIEQDADVVALIHRPAYYGINADRKGASTIGRGELIIAKNRNGPTGTVFFKHNSSITRIEPYVE